MKKNLLLISWIISVLIFESSLAATIVASSETTGRKCGDKCTWTLDSDGNLTISGTGAMYDYSHPGFNSSESSWSPWFNMTESVTNVVVENGITEIGQWAFKNVNASNISIPSSVTKVGYGFAETSSVKNLVIPDTVTSLGGAFCHDCQNLETLYISKNVDMLPFYSFSFSKKNIKPVVIPPNAEFDSLLGGIGSVTTYCTAAQMPTCGANSIEYEVNGDLFVVRDENGEMKEVYGGYANFNSNVLRDADKRDTFSVDEDGSITVKSANGSYLAKYSANGQMQMQTVKDENGTVAVYDAAGNLTGMSKKGKFTPAEAAMAAKTKGNTVSITW